MLEFKYTKANGDTSERVVFPICKPSDMLFCIDLTEFEDDERLQYYTALELLYEDLKDAIVDLGLNSQYRNFKKDGIEYVDT